MSEISVSIGNLKKFDGIEGWGFNLQILSDGVVLVQVQDYRYFPATGINPPSRKFKNGKSGGYIAISLTHPQITDLIYDELEKHIDVKERIITRANFTLEKQKTYMEGTK